MSVTMTVSEAEKIIDIVSEALALTGHRHRPVSALKGYDIYQICKALQLRIANEYLLLANRDDFEGQFAIGVNLYGGIPWQIIRQFVPDEQVDSIGAKMVFNPIDPVTMRFVDQRLSKEETMSSFADFCKSVGSGEPDYWKQIYARLGLEYTSDSPRGNVPQRTSV